MKHPSVENIEGVLSPEENILWHDSPKKGFKTTPLDLFMVPLGFILSCGACLFCYIVISRGHEKFATMVFPLSFLLSILLAGLYFAFGRFLLDSYKRKNTIYAVTSDRIVFISQFIKSKSKLLPLATTQMVEVTENSDGSGTITLATDSSLLAHSSRGHIAKMFWGNRGPSVQCLESVRDVRKVYGIISEAKQNIMVKNIHR